MTRNHSSNTFQSNKIVIGALSDATPSGACANSDNNHASQTVEEEQCNNLNISESS